MVAVAAIRLHHIHVLGPLRVASLIAVASGCHKKVGPRGWASWLDELGHSWKALVRKGKEFFLLGAFPSTSPAFCNKAMRQQLKLTLLLLKTSNMISVNCLPVSLLTNEICCSVFLSNGEEVREVDV